MCAFMCISVFAVCSKEESALLSQSASSFEAWSHSQKACRDEGSTDASAQVRGVVVMLNLRSCVLSLLIHLVKPTSVLLLYFSRIFGSSARSFALLIVTMVSFSVSDSSPLQVGNCVGRPGRQARL